MVLPEKHLPEEFVKQTQEIMGDELFGQYMKSFEQPTPVSIRLNPLKIKKYLSSLYQEGEKVPTPLGSYSTKDNPFNLLLATGFSKIPWCCYGYYLPTRPTFTFDPLFHAGIYYVQEASSMFLDHVLRQHLKEGSVRFLDLCAAPGGKSTLIRSILDEESELVSNEPIRNRAKILEENVMKWGYPHHIVTNQYPKDFRKAGERFDAILCDVPCSGEGMFRKDAATIDEWSPGHVDKCWRLQREIVNEAWQCLAEGGLFIYSTCTFNTKENEENVRWMMEELGAKVLPVAIDDDWNVTGSLLKGFNEPVYRFIPGVNRGEGLFVCVMEKRKGNEFVSASEERKARNEEDRSSKKNRESRNKKECGKKNHTYSHIHVQSSNESLPTAALTYQQAMAYLRHEAIVLPEETPRGIVVVTFKGVPLGEVKNIGNRANNLYPKEWSIKTTHIPKEYEPILNI